VPDVAAARGQAHALDFALAGVVEEAEFDRFGVPREEREIRAAAVPRSAERAGCAVFYGVAS
jgi:hypothetical protein